MYVTVIDNTPEARLAANLKARAMGLRWACSSNTGLPPNKIRVTYLPDECFEPTATDRETP